MAEPRGCRVRHASVDALPQQPPAARAIGDIPHRRSSKASTGLSRPRTIQLCICDAGTVAQASSAAVSSTFNLYRVGVGTYLLDGNLVHHSLADKWTVGLVETVAAHSPCRVAP